jgi:hypothetical protein
MAVTSSRSVQIQFSGDITTEVIKSADDNAASPGMEVVQTLASGANTITAPVVSGITVKALTIIPPSANTATITLKGITGDTGVPLHLTDPTSIGLASTFTSLVITASTTIIGVRFIWS